MRFQGTLKTWDEARGFGFIVPDQGGDEIFVHVKSIVNREGRPPVGLRLSFEVELGPRGKKRAKNAMPVRYVGPIGVRPAKRLHQGEKSASWGVTAVLAIPLFLAVCVAVASFWQPSLVFIPIYLCASLVTFFVYAFDKSAALRRTWRIRENTLHLLALAGGWPGALLAQQVLRHKSAKADFRAVFWITVFLNMALFVFLASPVGHEMWLYLGKR